MDERSQLRNAWLDIDRIRFRYVLSPKRFTTGVGHPGSLPWWPPAANSPAPMQQSDIKSFLDTMPPTTRKIVSTLRKVIRRTAPDAEESLLWGGMSYHRPKVGGRVKGSVCQIVVKPTFTTFKGRSVVEIASVAGRDKSSKSPPFEHRFGGTSKTCPTLP